MEESLHRNLLEFLGEWSRAEPHGSRAAGFDDSLAEVEFRYKLRTGRMRRMSLKAILRDDGNPGIEVRVFETDPDHTPPRWPR